jgi:hypothetical protein
MKINSFKASIVFILLVGLSVYAYIIAKAATTSFTHDESFSYLHYVHTSFMDIISFKDWYTNNHIMNSIGMKYSEQLFGSSEISLRLPNLLLFGVYMVYSFFLFQKSNPFILAGIFILLCTNTSIIDLFGLARGYGLSFGFMLMSVYHFIQSFYGSQKKNLILFHIGSLFAVLSNFTMLDIYVVLLFIYNVLVFIDCKFISNKNYHFFSSNKIHLLPILVNTAILFEPVRRVTMNSNLDFGGKNGLYSDTVKDLINYSLHDLTLSPIALMIAKIIFTGILLIPLAIIIRMICKKNVSFFNNYKGLIIFQHIILKADYPIARFSLFLLPLFIIHFGFLLVYMNDLHKRVALILVPILALLSCASFVSKTDMHSCSEWGYDAETKNMIQQFSDYHSTHATNSDSVKMGINWLFEPTINFYRATKNINWLIPVNRNGILPNDDYYYLFTEELNQLDSINYNVLHKFVTTNTVLIKNNSASSIN